MYFRTKTRGKKTYLQLVHTFRANGCPKQVLLHSFGAIDTATIYETLASLRSSIDHIIQKCSGTQPAPAAAPAASSYRSLPIDKIRDRRPGPPNRPCRSAKPRSDTLRPKITHSPHASRPHSLQPQPLIPTSTNHGPRTCGPT